MFIACPVILLFHYILSRITFSPALNFHFFSLQLIQQNPKVPLISRVTSPKRYNSGHPGLKVIIQNYPSWTVRFCSFCYTLYGSHAARHSLLFAKLLTKLSMVVISRNRFIRHYHEEIVVKWFGNGSGKYVKL